MNLEPFLRKKQWELFDFQHKALTLSETCDTLLINAPTGFGKSLAGLLASITPSSRETNRTIIWVTPLRALANDLTFNLNSWTSELMPRLRFELWTGDTSPAKKKKFKSSFPPGLITTPESLSIMLTYPECQEQLHNISAVVCDEWHEMFGTKRGVLLELALARIRTFSPEVRVTGLSATLGNPETALKGLTGSGANQSAVIRSTLRRKWDIKILSPHTEVSLPYAGHLGLSMATQLMAEINPGETALFFTNTRNQAERWYQEIVRLKSPEQKVALHHGSLDRKERQSVEAGLKNGSLNIVVCTSSLDLGVDYPPVSKVAQIGSPKGVARFYQRAGRSGHSPLEKSAIVCVPTNSFELLEFVCVRQSSESEFEEKSPLVSPVDVLLQHIVSSALVRTDIEALFKEVKSTDSFRSLTRTQFNWAADFVTTGGKALRAYDQYRKVQIDNGTTSVSSSQIARYHRMSVGTITSDSSVTVRYARGAVLGQVEERFIASLKPGTKFIFGGKGLELIQIREMRPPAEKV